MQEFERDHVAAVAVAGAVDAAHAAAGCQLDDFKAVGEKPSCAKRSHRGICRWACPWRLRISISGIPRGERQASVRDDEYTGTGTGSLAASEAAAHCRRNSYNPTTSTGRKCAR